MGFSSLDYTVTEIKRTDRLSVLRIPGFHKRTAAASRWMMCVYTDLAIKRGFKFWSVVYPEAQSEDLIVGFPQSENEDIARTLGPEFGTKYALTVTSVQKMSMFCDRMQKGSANSAWSVASMRGIKQGCLNAGNSSAFCECWTQEVTSRISGPDFLELMKKTKTDESEKVRANAFLEPIMSKCTQYNHGSAQELHLQPKYGLVPKSEAQLATDAKFIAGIDEQYKGNRKKASEDIASRGWQLLRQGQGNNQEAMKRFNQAWLVDNSNGIALWGMAVVQSSLRKHDQSLRLFAEAEGFVGSDIDFSADYAKAIGVAGAQAKNNVLLNDAFSRFTRVYERAPQHTLNLQNWAITLFYVGSYAEAWNKVKLAEATPRHADLDTRFITALQSKMPRP